MSLSTLERTRPYPDVKPRIERRVVPEHGLNRDNEWGVVGYDTIEVAHCDRHGTQGDGWCCDETSRFCGPCAEEVAEWERTNPFGGSREPFDQRERSTERAELEYLRRLER